MGLAKLLSGTLQGLEGMPVEIEADVSRMGDPQIVIVGLPDATVRESQHRVTTAITNSGYTPFNGRITVNLAPADVRKDGSLFDLPIALAILMASGELSGRRERGKPEFVFNPATTAFAGELSLGGNLRPIRGALPLAISLRENGCRTLLVPEENAAEAAVVEGLDVYPVKSLRHAADILTGDDNGETSPIYVDMTEVFNTSPVSVFDFADVKGQEIAKYGITVAVAGGHNVLLSGPPGTGKSMMARCIPTILPPLTLDEALEVTKIQSISGLLPPNTPLVRERPFRSPHHTVSDVALIGGGTHPSPGEVTLSHHGVLFLDELPEFNRSVLEVMRQPLEDGFVSISRASGSARFPCRFMLIAAMNPCPCGYYGSSTTGHTCRCSSIQIKRYHSKISGPLLDRIDIQLSIQTTDTRDLQSIPKGASSAQLREMVLKARAIQNERFKHRPGPRTNAAMTRREIDEFCHMDEQCVQIMNFAIRELGFSPRAHDRILRVARTVADMAGHSQLQPEDLQEALAYRQLDRAM